MERMHVTVNGVFNSQNKTSLKNALEQIDGVQTANVDMSQRSVEVSYHHPATESSIRSCITNNGFTIE